MELGEKRGGAQFGTDVELLAKVVAVCRKVTKLPLITKMSPNVVSIAPYAKAAEDAGSDALAITNSYPAMAIDIHTRKPKLADSTSPHPRLFLGPTKDLHAPLMPPWSEATGADLEMTGIHTRTTPSV